MKKEGFIYLHRKLLDWEWYDDANTFRLFIHLLLKANFKETKYRNNIVKRGQLVTTRTELSNELGLTEQQIRTSINKLKLTNEITSKSTNKKTFVTLNRYELYQNDKNKITNKATNNQPTNQPTKQPTNNHINNQENEVLINSLSSSYEENGEEVTDKPTNKATNKSTNKATNVYNKNNINNINNNIGYIGESENFQLNIAQSGFLIDEMLSAWRQKNETYFFDAEKDKPALLKIAYKIAEIKKIEKGDVSYKQKKEVLDSWEEIIDFVAKDNFLSNLSIHNLNNQFQLLIQKMNNQKKSSKNQQTKNKPLNQKNDGMDSGVGDADIYQNMGK